MSQPPPGDGYDVPLKKGDRVVDADAVAFFQRNVVTGPRRRLRHRPT